MGNILDVKNLSVSFNTYAGEVKAVRNVSFHLGEGETLAFVGESGCGKSVTAKSLMRLLPKENSVIKPESQILFDGKEVTKMSSKELTILRGNQISMVFQDPMTSLNPTMRVGAQIVEALMLHRSMKKKEADEEALRLMKLVQIPNAEYRLKAYPHELSGGMRQRAMIAIALSCNPKILLADEPTTALDVTIQAQILDLLQDLKTELQTAIILVTHDLGVVANFAQRIQVMYAGEIIEEGTTEEIFYEARHPYTWALLNSIPSMTNRGKRLHSLAGTPPDLLLPLEGCPFVSRCDYAMKVCKQTHPECTVHSDTHRSWCWLEDNRSGFHDWDALRKGERNE